MVVICEEIAFMDIRVINEVVAPVLVKEGVAFLCISTLDSSDSFFCQLLNAKMPNGKPVIHQVHIELVCDDCKRNGEMKTCNHKMYLIPYWHDIKQHEKLERLMESNYDTYLQETRGMLLDGNITAAFKSTLIDRVINENNFVRVINFSKYVYFMIDPAGGGRGSDYSMVSVINAGGGAAVVIGAECISACHDTEQIADSIMAHIAAVRKIPALKDAIAVINTENNWGMEAARTKEDLLRRGIRNAHFIQDKDGRDGVRTSSPLKKAMVIQMNRFLETDRLKFYQQFVTVSSGKTPHDMMMTIVNQLRSYRRIVTPSRVVGVPAKETYSGKGAGKDDLCICLQLYAITLILHQRNLGSQ